MAIFLAVVVLHFAARNEVVAQETPDLLVTISSPSENQILTAVPGDTFVYQVVAYDPENAPLSYTLEHWPHGMKIDATSGILTWTTTNEFVGRKVEVAVSASDRPLGSNERYNRTVHRIFSVLVENTPSETTPVATPTPTPTPIPINNPPVVSAPQHATEYQARAGEQFQVQVQASDPEDKRLTYVLIASPPNSNVTFSQNGVIQWRPNERFAGKTWP